MKQRKKMWLGMTSAVLSMALITAGCAKGNTNSQQSSGDAGNTSANEKPIEIVWANNWDAPSKDDNYVQKYIEQKFNVKIKNVKFERQGWDQKFNVSLASGEIPDVFPADVNINQVVTWAQQGIIASISADEIRKYMPNYSKQIDAVDPTAWTVGVYNGKNWGVPRVWPDGATGFLPAYNGKWLKAIGYNEPPKTLAEMEDVFTKFTNNDPDGDGKKDTYGLSGRGKDAQAQMFNSIFAAFGFNHYSFKVGADGKLVYGAITEEARQALKLLNKWYKAGIIDPEFITTDNGGIQTKFVGGKTGYVENGLWYHLTPDGYFGKAAQDKGVDLVVGKPVTGPDGNAYAFSYGPKQPPVIFGSQLEKDEKKRDKILQIMDYMATNEEGYLTAHYGQKDVSYTLNGTVPTWKAPYDDATKRGEMGIGAFYDLLGGNVLANAKYNYTPEKLAFKAKVTDGVKTITDPLGPAVLQSKAKYDAILKTLQDTYYIKAITGEVDTDKGFDDFKAQWLKSGGQEVTDEANKVYADRNKK